MLKFFTISPWLADKDGRWTVEEASSKLAIPSDGSDVQREWWTTFGGGVAFEEEKGLEYLEKHTNPVYDTRYDLTFLTPSSRKLRCKVKREYKSSLIASNVETRQTITFSL